MYDNLTKEQLEKLRNKKRHEIINCYLTHDDFTRDILELDLKIIDETIRLNNGYMIEGERYDMC